MIITERPSSEARRHRLSESVFHRGNRLRPLELLALAAALAFVALAVWGLWAGSRDWDEGVYWQTLRAISRGEPLYRSVYSAEPPVFYYLLMPFLWLGHSIVALRAGVFLFAALGLALIYLIGRQIAGHSAGLMALILLATSPIYIGQSNILQTEAPAIGVGLAAMLFALLATATRDARRIWLAAALSGLALALAIGTKLSGVILIVPVLAYVVPGAEARRQRATAFVAGFLAGSAIWLAPILTNLPSAYQQLVVHHLAAGQPLLGGVFSNVNQLLHLRELPLEAVALLGALAAVARHDRRIIVPLIWTMLTAIAIALYQPLFPHHLALLIPGLALIAAIGMSELTPAAASLPAWLRRKSRTASPAVALLLLVVALCGCAVAVRDSAQLPFSDQHDDLLAAAIRDATAPGDYVVTDNQFAASLADRDLPPNVVDTSKQRIETGLLTLSDLEATVQRYKVRVVLIDGPRLIRVPGMTAWLDEHASRTSGIDGARIYLLDNLERNPATSLRPRPELLRQPARLS